MVDISPEILSSVVDDLSRFVNPTVDDVVNALATYGVSPSDVNVSDVVNALANPAGAITGGIVRIGGGAVDAASSTLGDIGSGIYDLVAAHPVITAGTILGVTAIGGYEVTHPGTATISATGGSSGGGTSNGVTPAITCSPACTGKQVCGTDGTCQFNSIGDQIHDQGIGGTVLSWFGTGLLGQTPNEVAAWAESAKPWTEGLIVVGALVGVAYAAKTFWPKSRGSGEVFVSAGRRLHR